MKNVEIFLYLLGDPDYKRTVYSDRTESNRILKLTTTPIFCSQRTREQFLEIHEISQNDTFIRGWGQFWKVFM